MHEVWGGELVSGGDGERYKVVYLPVRDTHMLTHSQIQCICADWGFGGRGSKELAKVWRVKFKSERVREV